MMDRSVRYERLTNEDDIRPSEPNQMPSSPETPTTVVISVEHASAPILPDDHVIYPPPPYIPDRASAAASSEATDNPDDLKYMGSPHVPPSYNVATELPTYDQVQQLKLEEEQRRQDVPHLDPETLDRGEALLGTDFMFLCSFFVAFLFNWIGFVMLMCSCPTIAGRYGALAGFGLSLAKWTLIAKHSVDFFNTDNSWLWWLIMAFGMLICVRAILQYIHIKREWQILNRAAQERPVLH